MVKWQVNKQCNECPWRKDVQPGKFPLSRFEELRPCVEQGFGRMFACHRSPECNKRACVGYVVNQVYGPGNGPENFHLRHALAMRKIDPEKMTITGPQYLTYDEMVEANRLTEEE
jgi:hypothetical protein